MARRCWVPNCRNGYGEPGVKLFLFPRNLERCAQWLKAIGDPTLVSCSWKTLISARYVCIEHFMPRMISATNRVLCNAAPTRFTDVRPELPEEMLKMFLERGKENRGRVAPRAGNVTVGSPKSFLSTKCEPAPDDGQATVVQHEVSKSASDAGTDNRQATILRLTSPESASDAGTDNRQATILRLTSPESSPDVGADNQQATILRLTSPGECRMIVSWKEGIRRKIPNFINVASLIKEHPVGTGRARLLRLAVPKHVGNAGINNGQAILLRLPRSGSAPHAGVDNGRATVLQLIISEPAQNAGVVNGQATVLQHTSSEPAQNAGVGNGQATVLQHTSNEPAPDAGVDNESSLVLPSKSFECMSSQALAVNNTKEDHVNGGGTEQNQVPMFAPESMAAAVNYQNSCSRISVPEKQMDEQEIVAESILKIEEIKQEPEELMEEVDLPIKQEPEELMEEVDLPIKQEPEELMEEVDLPIKQEPEELMEEVDLPIKQEPEELMEEVEPPEVELASTLDGVVKNEDNIEGVLEPTTSEGIVQKEVNIEIKQEPDEFLEDVNPIEMHGPQLLKSVVKKEEDEELEPFAAVFVEAVEEEVEEENESPAEMHSEGAPIASGDTKESSPDAACSATSSSGESLSQPRRVHTESGETCSFCQKKFERKENLMAHMLAHTGELPFKCSTCQGKFSRKANFIKHMLTHTRKLVFECPICRRDFSYRTSLSAHCKRIHRVERLFECSICEKNFPRREELQEHTRVHSVERSLKCGGCQKKCTPNHEVLDSKKPFECSICQKAFSYRVNLRNHVQAHTGEKPYKCSVCQKRLSQNGHLKALKISGERSFECSACQKKFKNEEALMEHLREHKAER